MKILLAAGVIRKLAAVSAVQIRCLCRDRPWCAVPASSRLPSRSGSGRF